MVVISHAPMLLMTMISSLVLRLSSTEIDKHREYYLKENNKSTTGFILIIAERLKRKIEKLRLKGES